MTQTSRALFSDQWLVVKWLVFVGQTAALGKTLLFPAVLAIFCRQNIALISGQSSSG